MEPLALSLERLRAFRDLSCLRDPRGRSGSPSLESRRGELVVRGPFQLRRTLLPLKERGVTFVRATGDANPIHVDGDVLAGAFTAAQMVAPVEVLFPRVAFDALQVSFTGLAWYGRPLRVVTRVTPSPRGLTLSSEAFQGDRVVARGEARGRVLDEAARVEVPLRRLDVAWLGRVGAFFSSLGIEPGAYLEKAEGPDASYPYAFLASLPSGTMVERLSGQGGILNRLTLDFDPAKLPIAGPPEVSLEMPSRVRASFNKVLTFIKEGVRTAARGAALILPKSSGSEDLLKKPAE